MGLISFVTDTVALSGSDGSISGQPAGYSCSKVYGNKVKTKIVSETIDPFLQGLMYDNPQGSFDLECPPFIGGRTFYPHFFYVCVDCISLLKLYFLDWNTIPGFVLITSAFPGSRLPFNNFPENHICAVIQGIHPVNGNFVVHTYIGEFTFTSNQSQAAVYVPLIQQPSVPFSQIKGIAFVNPVYNPPTRTFTINGININRNNPSESAPTDNVGGIPSNWFFQTS